ncbi:hypothetical protein BDF19DRAFT_437056 [Syncephalis fuscata]|nr:hypothetical protein BDF19DRAFT_437056 [Syncephalis fuscata]
MATPQHHAKAPARPSLRSPLFANEGARRDRTVSFAGDDDPANASLRYSHGTAESIIQTEPSAIKISMDVDRTQTNESIESIQVNTSEKNRSLTPSLIICDMSEMDNAKHTTDGMVIRQPLGFSGQTISGSSTTVVSSNPNYHSNNNTMDSTVSQQSSNTSHLTSMIVDEIADCYQTIPSTSKSHLF